MNYKKLVLSKVLMAILMMLFAINVNVQAQDIANGTSGTCKWSIDSNGKLVVEPSTGTSGTLGLWYTYVQGMEDGAPWYQYHDQITSAEVKAGVRATTCEAFFQNCSKLTTVDLSGLNTSGVYTMMSMFADCSSLTELDLSNFSTTSVTSVQNMFSECTSLKRLDISNFDTQNVTNFGGMFDSCLSLESIDLSNFNTSKATSMMWMFNNCSSLTSLDVSGFDTQNVTSMNYMFNYCSSLHRLDISKFVTDNVTKMNNMFSGCSGLAYLNVSNFNTEKVTDMSYMFSNCSNLRRLDVSSFDFEKTTTVDKMFAGCNMLEYLDLTGFNIQNTTTAVDFLKDCYNLGTIVSYTESPNALPENFFNNNFPYVETCALVIPEETTNIYLETTGWQDFNNMQIGEPGNDYIAEGESGSCSWYITSEGRLIIEPTDGRSGRLGYWEMDAPWHPFREEIISARVENGVSAQHCEGMFKGCINMEWADINGLNTSNVMNMRQMFYNCKSLERVALDEINTQEVEDFQQMFYGCESLKKLDLSNFNTGYVGSMSQMFEGCSSLEELNVSSFSTDNVYNMASMFKGCSSLRYLDLTGFNTNNTEDMSAMFQGCESLERLSLGEFTTNEETITNWTFSGCDNLTRIYAHGEVPPTMKEGTFASSFENREACMLFTPQGTAGAYGTATGWNELGEGMEYVQIEGESGGCRWYITEEGKLIVEPIDGRSGTLDDWEVDAPWIEYSEEILLAEIMPGVKATNCMRFFDGCVNLRKADISQLDASEASSMDHMFANCESLESVNTNGTYPRDVTDMSYMFYNCKSLESIYLGSFSTENVTTMASMFEGCTTLHIIETAAMNTEKVTDMSRMFYGCTAVDTLALTGLVVSDETIVEDMFTNMPKLRVIYATSSEPSYLKAGTFANSFTNRKKAKLIVAYGKVRDYKAASGWNEIGFITDEDYYAKGESGGCIWYITKDDYKFVVEPANGESGTLGDWTANGNISATAPWFEYAASILSAQIMPGVSAVTCGSFFNGCENMTSVDFSELNTENATNMFAMFRNCKSLKELNVSTLNTAKVENMQDMFRWCEGLTTLDVSTFKTENVTDMGDMFMQCTSLESINLGNISTENVTSMNSMFSQDAKLTSLDLTSFNTSKVTGMNAMFQNCSSLETLRFGNFVVGSNTGTDLMFDGCESLNCIYATEETVPSMKEGTFADSFEKRHTCDLVVPLYSYAAYSGASGWDEIGQIIYEEPKDYYLATGTSGTCLWYIIRRSGELCVKPTNGESGTLEDWMNSAPWTAYNSSIRSATIFSGVNAATCLHFFYECNNLTDVNISELNTENVTDMTGMFRGCSALIDINLSSLKTANVTNMTSMFENCSLLRSLYNINGFNTSNVENMTNMFQGCSALTSLDLYGFDTQKVTIMASMFANCTSLKELTLTNFNTSSVTNMMGMFSNCSSLEHLNISNFDAANCQYTDGMFGSMSSLKTLSTPMSMVGGTSYPTFGGNTNLLQLKWNSPNGIPASELRYLDTEGNLIIFVPSETEEESEVKANIVKFGWIDELELKEGMPMYTTEQFMARKVNYTRSFTKKTINGESAGWETIVLPFNVTKVTSESIGELTPFRGGAGDKHFWLYGLTENGFGRASRIAANIPYIIAMPNFEDGDPEYNVEGNVTFSAEDVFIEPTVRTNTWKGSKFDLQGTYENKDDDMNIFILNDQEFYDYWTGRTYVPGSAFIRISEFEAEQARPFHAYATVNNKEWEAKRVLPIFGYDDEEDDATGIMTIDTVKTSQQPTIIYDIMGRRIATPRKGLNIINGKKMLKQ